VIVEKEVIKEVIVERPTREIVIENPSFKEGMPLRYSQEHELKQLELKINITENEDNG
jgi:hypothetical protein